MINETPESTPKNQEPIVFNFDENDFDFKPVTKGLGFHKNKKEEKRVKVTPRKANGVINNFTDSVSTQNNPAMANSDLAAFYSDQKQQISDYSEVKKKVNKVKKINRLQKAPMFNQFAGFAIDMILIMMATGITVALLMLISGLEYNLLIQSLGELEIAKYILSLFVIYFVSYFTILDVAGTVGKSMMSVHLVNIEGKKLKLKHTFIRTCITLLSFSPLVSQVFLIFKVV